MHRRLSLALTPLCLLVLLVGCTPVPVEVGDPPVDADGDGYAATDCNDGDPRVHPSAPELCNGVDDNCDARTDEDVRVTFWPDADGDGYGAGTSTLVGCEAPAGYVADGTDCDDLNASINPGAVEACNGTDDNCDGVPDDGVAAWYRDADADGFGDPATAEETCAPDAGQVADGTDCDDADPLVNPGVEEVCDRDDDNCDGVTDLGVVQTWHTDTDGDGYGHMYNLEDTCDPAPGWVLDGSDCRPGDAEAFPGAAERCNDDDDDCDGEVDEDFELDGDGHTSTACGGDDCDDTDPAVNPDGVEICDDGLDNDCDGDDTRCGFGGDWDLGAVSAKIYSDEPNYDAGRVVDVGDINADGFDDVVVATMYADGYNGGAYVLYGPITGTDTLDNAGHRLVGSRRTYAAGRSIGVGDVDGDGYEDVGVGAPDGTEKEWILLGPITADTNVADGEILYYGDSGSEVGHGSDLADVDGDGISDAVIGAYQDTTGGYDAGSVFIAYGPLVAGEYDITAVHDAQLIGDTPGAYAGRYIRAGADVDGDGIGDILAAAPYSSASGSYAGMAYLIYGGVLGDFDMGASDGLFLGETPGDYASEELAMGDVDGDGLADVILGSWSSIGGRMAGAAYVVHGPASGTVDLASADFVLRGDAVGQQFGLGLASADLDEDGADELLVAAIGDNSAGADAGAAYLYFGPLTSGSVGPSDADAAFYGERAGDQAGEGLAIGDLDANGELDLVFGAPGEATGGGGGGAIYVQYPVE